MKNLIVIIYCINISLFAMCEDKVEDISALNIHIYKGGSGWINIILSSNNSTAELHSLAIKENLHLYGFEIYPNENDPYSIRATFKDVFALIRFFDTSTPFKLRTGNLFNISWNGKLLSIKYGDTIKNTNESCSHNGFDIITITTDGTFLEESKGIISDNKQKIILRNGFRCIHLSIDDLSE